DVESHLASLQEFCQRYYQSSTSSNLNTGWGAGGSSFPDQSSSGPGAPPPQELQWMVDELKVLSEDLGDLEKTIKAVEGDRTGRFEHIQAGERARRKEFVERSRRIEKELKRTLVPTAASPSSRPTTGNRATPQAGNSRVGSNTASPAIDPRKAAMQKERDQLMSMKGGATRVDQYGRTEKDHQESNQRFIDREHGVQQQIMRQQDVQLDEVMDTVGNLREVAVVMGREMDDQTALLEDLDTRVDTTSGKLKMGMKKLQDFIKANAGE
ncbi:Syntaxin-6, partial [Irineochytrium annulatum]